MSTENTDYRTIAAAVQIHSSSEGQLVTALAALKITEAEFIQQAFDHALMAILGGAVLHGTLVESLADAQNTRRLLMDRLALSITISERIIADQQAVTHRLLSATQNLTNA